MSIRLRRSPISVSWRQNSGFLEIRMKKNFAVIGAISLLVFMPACKILEPGSGGGGGGGGSKNPADCPGSDCKVDIVVMGTTVTADPEFIHIHNNDASILWKLPSDYRFCPDGKDGVWFKDDKGGQFYDNYSTDDPNGRKDSGNGAKKNYHWKDKKTDPQRTTYAYSIRFHPKDHCEAPALGFDPGVVNEM
jgi:hypothetical protein